jgi:arylsulfatase A-like enzyme
LDIFIPMDRGMRTGNIILVKLVVSFLGSGFTSLQATDPAMMNPVSALATPSSYTRFPAARGGVSEHLWDNSWIEDWLTPSFGSSRQAARSFNILFIAVDDLKPLLGCYGDTLAVTPHIDALAARGTLFRNNHCQQAVCAPSRVSLMTSRYPDQTMVWDLQTQMREMDPGIVSLPQYLRRFGYQTAATGKVFDPRSVDPDRDAPSWSIPYLGPWAERFYDPGTGKPAAYYYASQEAKDTIAILQGEARELGVDEMTYVKEHYFPAFESAEVPYNAYSDGAIVNAGIELLEQVATKESPFFLAVGFNRPHLPFNAPREFWDLYDRDDFSLAAFRQRAEESPDVAYHNYSELRSYTGIPDTGSVPEQTQVTLIHGYYAATSYIDHLVGMLLARLEELELAGNTAVVLWGDHGWHLGDHDLWCKHSNFEQATRSPMIISVPGQALPGTGTRSPTEFTDLAPTLCEIAGVALPVCFEGLSLVPLMSDTLASVREGALSQYPRNGKMGYSLRTERYRYTRWVNSDGSLHAAELYDYREDPMETLNLAGSAGHDSIRHRLDSILRNRMLIPSTQYKIRFMVSGMGKEGDTLAITDARVQFAGATYRTGKNGELQLTHVGGEFGYEISAAGYDPFTGTVKILNDTLVMVYVGEPYMEVNVRVVNYYTGRGVVNSRVSMNRIEKMSDGEGLAIFTLKAGTFLLNLDHDTYLGITDTVHVESDTGFVYRLEPSHAVLKFWLKEGNAPVIGASVTLDTDMIVTNALGMSTFQNVPTGISYPYSLEKEGYELVSGEVFPLTDTTIIFQMNRTPSVFMDDPGFRFKVYPNPASGKVNIELPGNRPFLLSLFSGTGQILYLERIGSSRYTLDCSMFGSGIYFIKLQSGGHSVTRKFLIK